MEDQKQLKQEHKGPLKPLAGRVIAITRGREQRAGMVRQLEALGAEVWLHPVMELRPIDARSQLLERLEEPWGLVVWTSANGVRFTLQQLGSRAASALAALPVACVGEATARAAREAGLEPRYIPPRADAASLVAWLEGQLELAGMRCLFPCSRAARPTLVEGLTHAGAEVVQVVVYGPHPHDPDPTALREALAAGALDAVTLASPLTLQLFLDNIGRDFARRCPLWVAIGPTTQRALRDEGLAPILTPKTPGIGPMIEAMVSHFRGGPPMSDERWRESQAWYARAQKSIPGGVNSPVRAFRSVQGQPPFIRRGKGAYMWDEDGHRYIDYVGSWGPLILGHAPDAVLAALSEAAAQGTSFGAPTKGEVLLAEKICSFFPAMDMVRLVNSGTEATMSAIRLARAATKRDKIVKFEGCYHGHGDSFLIAAGSGAMTFGVPNSPGVTAATAADTLLAPFNDLDAVAALFREHPQQIAGVILEPVPGNMGLVLPHEGFLQGLRDLTQEAGALLIFDEVMTGWRVDQKSAQGYFGVHPDLTTLGKVIGGGLPVGAYGGKREYMEQISPSGPVYQAGTLSGNPLAVAAGLATLEVLEDPAVYQALEARAAALEAGIQDHLKSLDLPYTAYRLGTMFCLYFHPGPVTDFESAKAADTERFGRYHHAMLKRGVYLAPSQFEAGFLSTAHTDQDIEATLEASYASLKEVS